MEFKNIYIELQETPCSQTILKNKSKVGGLLVFNLKTFYKTIVISGLGRQQPRLGKDSRLPGPQGDSLPKMDLPVPLHFFTFWPDPGSNLTSDWGHILLCTFMKKERVGHRETQRSRLESGLGKEKGRGFWSVSLSPLALQRLQS